MTSDDPIFSHPFRATGRAQRRPSRFDIRPDDAAQARIAGALGLLALDSLRFKGALTPQGRRDWLMEARLTARVAQPCVVTLAPVVTEIAEDVRRRYVADLPEPEGEEIEMPEDDSVEALPSVIDAGAVMIEALSLALPLYPRAAAAELGAAEFAPPGAAPLTDKARRPFSGLADLMRKGKAEE